MAENWQVEISALRGDVTVLNATQAQGVSFERYVTGKTGQLTATLPAPNPTQAEHLRALVRDDASLTLGCYLRRGRDMWYGGRIDDIDVKLGRIERTIQLSSTTFEGYLDDRIWATTTTWAGTEQLEMARQIWQSVLAAEGDMGIDVPAVTASGITRDLTVTRADNRTARSILDEFSHRTNGFEWMINIYLVGSTRHRELLLGYPTITRGSIDTLSYPGALLAFSRKSTRAGGGTRFWGRGSAPDNVGGAAQPSLTSPILRVEDLLSTGAVLIDNVLDETDVKVQATLDARAAEHRTLRSGVRTYVTAQARVSDISASLLGNQALLRISDPLYPPGPKGAPGLQSTHRVIGLKVKADERGQSEVADLIFEEA